MKVSAVNILINEIFYDVIWGFCDGSTCYYASTKSDANEVAEMKLECNATNGELKATKLLVLDVSRYVSSIIDAHAWDQISAMSLHIKSRM